MIKKYNLPCSDENLLIEVRYVSNACMEQVMSKVVSILHISKEDDKYTLSTDGPWDKVHEAINGWMSHICDTEVTEVDLKVCMEHTIEISVTEKDTSDEYVLHKVIPQAIATAPPVQPQGEDLISMLPQPKLVSFNYTYILPS